jgi:hypothetical protein
MSAPAKPTYYWDKESNSYKSIPTGKNATPKTEHTSGDVYENEAAVAERSAKFTYEDLIEKEWRDLNEKVKPTQIDPINGKDAFQAGFRRGWDISGELAAQTGFVNGAHTAIKQLTAPTKATRFEYVDPTKDNNELEQPRSNLESVRRDNLTAEIVNVLAAYAILPVDAKIAATLDALQSTFGVKFKREKDHE